MNSAGISFLHELVRRLAPGQTWFDARRRDWRDGRDRPWAPGPWRSTDDGLGPADPGTPTPGGRESTDQDPVYPA